MIRELARSHGLTVVDLFQRMRQETLHGNWDLRVRGYGVVDATIPVIDARDDHLHAGDVRWWTNIHPNVQGVAVIADEEARVMRRQWPRLSREA